MGLIVMILMDRKVAIGERGIDRSRYGEGMEKRGAQPGRWTLVCVLLKVRSLKQGKAPTDLNKAGKVRSG